MNLDIHCHIITPEYLDAIRRPDNVYGERRVPNAQGGEDVVTRSGMAFELIPQLRDPVALLADLNRVGVDAAVVSPVPTQFHFNLEPAAAEAHCRLLNDGIADLAKAYSGRLIGMALVPLQHPDLAVAELTRSVEQLGLRSAEICTNVNGKNLDEPELFRFFARAAELGVVVLIHPWFVAGADRLRRYHLINSVGNPVDTTIAAGSLIFGGVFERLPTLKVVFAHAGGAVPYTIGRMDRAHMIRPDARQAIPRPPSTYLRQAFFDTVAHSAAALTFLIETYGADRVLLGSDFPFHVYDMGDPDPVGSVVGLERIDAGAKKRILGANAAELLGLGVCPS